MPDDTMTPERLAELTRAVSMAIPLTIFDQQALCTSLHETRKNSKGWRERCEHAERERKVARLDIERVGWHFGIKRTEHNCYDNFVGAILQACYEGARARRAQEMQRDA